MYLLRIEKQRWLDVLLWALILSISHALDAQVSVLTQHNDNSRSGNNLHETKLTASNVNVSTFGKLFTVTLDGYVFAQPLYVPSLNIAGATHNVVYVATAGDSIFAVDADTGTQLWTKNYGTPVPSSVINTANILVQVGIISTPVIDPSTMTMYFVTKTYENQVQIFRLHAIDITNGTEKFKGPIVISASVNGSGAGNDGQGHVLFQASQENQRPAVTLANGVVYLAFASHEDHTPYHGWVLGYSASTLQQLYVFNDSPNGDEGGIWQSGQGPVVDSNNNVYVMVGNGTTDAQIGGSDYGEAFLKLSPTLSVLDYFIPNNFDALNSADQDVSSGGPLLIPGTNYIVGQGKQGLMYVVNTTNMGHYNLSQDPVEQEFSTGEGIWGAPVFFNSPTNPALYIWNSSSALQGFSFSHGTFATSPSASGSVSISGCCAGGALSISSNNYAAGSNILWASVPLTSPIHSLASGQLFAYDATNINHELWDSYQNQARDDFGYWAKFVPPTVANGKVYVGSDSGNGQLVAYGLLPVTQTVTTIDDAVSGVGGNHFEYVGSWNHCSNCGSNLYDGTNSWDNVKNDYVTVAFTGTGIKFYGVQDPKHGIGAVSIDGGTETNIDFYAATRAGDVLLWTSPVLAAGDHIFKLRVTGTKNANSTNTFALADRVDILSNTSNPAPPINLSAAGQTSSILLSWTGSTNAQYYNVYRGSSPGAESESPIASPTTTTYTDSNVVAGTTYYYTVAAVSSSGTSAPSNEALGDVGTVLANGVYTVTNSAGTLVWDDPSFSGSPGTNVQLYPSNGGSNQKWTLTSVGNGYYTITNQASDLLLQDPASNTTPGTKLVQSSSSGGTNQKWLITISGAGFIITNRFSGLVIDPSADTKTTDIVQATATGASNQVWFIH